jgi:hypothetical protein
MRLKAILLDTNLYLHHKNPEEMLFIEVDASDVGWGVCAYQMVLVWTGDPDDQARARINDTGKIKIIEWISKSWNEHELKLPVFYRETLARLLCLERFRNLIETNIVAGITLYTDHKPGLFENSLSNKGQLSAWRIAETADLQSIVQTHYRQGSKMVLADPLLRLCSPSSGFFDPYPRNCRHCFDIYQKISRIMRMYVYTHSRTLLHCPDISSNGGHQRIL